MPELTKEQLVDAILLRMSDSNSMYEIEPRRGGFCLIRSWEISNLEDYPQLPSDGVSEKAWKPTLAELHDYIIKREGPWVGIGENPPLPERFRAKAAAITETVTAPTPTPPAALAPPPRPTIRSRMASLISKII